MPTLSRIRIHGQGDIEVEFVIDYLVDLRHAYNSILVFESTFDRAFRDFGAQWDEDYPRRPWGLRPVCQVRDWPTNASEISSLIPYSEQLVLAKVQLQSPGFWEIVGALSPLEFITRYLNDRHERRKDREYREDAEKRKLRLENMLLEDSLVAGRLRLAREYGANERDLALVVNELLLRPLTSLDRHQERGVIENAELIQPPDQSLPKA